MESEPRTPVIERLIGKVHPDTLDSNGVDIASAPAAPAPRAKLVPAYIVADTPNLGVSDVVAVGVGIKNQQFVLVKGRPSHLVCRNPSIGRSLR